MKPQLNDRCPNCIKYSSDKIGKLQYMKPYEPYSNAHLGCSECSSTYTLHHKILWQEDINNLASNMHDVMEIKVNEMGMILTREVSDRIYDKIVNAIDELGTSDYRNYN